jgi:murein DD-endopeptidase MepM/ murein hydrolase activator NlpD
MRHRAPRVPALWTMGTMTVTVIVLSTALGSAGAVGRQPARAHPAGRAHPVGVPRAATGEAGDRQRKLDRQLAQLRSQLEGSSRELVTAAENLSRARYRLVTVRADLALAQDRLRAAQREDDAVGSRLAYALAQETKAQGQLRERVEQVDAARASLGRIARQSYLSAGLPGLELALDAATPQDFADRLVATGTVLRLQGSTVNRMAVQQSDLRARTAGLQALRIQIDELKERSRAAVVAREEATDRAERVRSEQAALVTQASRATAAIQARVSQEKARLAELNVEQNRLRIRLAARARALRESRARAGRAGAPPSTSSPSGGRSGSSGGSGGSSGGSGPLDPPVNGPITSPFGPRYHPILHYSRMHTGVDYGVGCGVPVRAAAPGQVISAGRAGGYGNRIVVDHGLVGKVGLATTYNHMSRFAVTGGHVSRGQVIGYVGTTGLSTGCHLHYEVLRDGAYVDPTRY